MPPNRDARDRETYAGDPGLARPHGRHFSQQFLFATGTGPFSSRLHRGWSRQCPLGNAGVLDRASGQSAGGHTIPAQAAGRFFRNSPNDPSHMSALYITDGIHPNNAGHQAMADAINLSLLLR